MRHWDGLDTVGCNQRKRVLLGFHKSPDVMLLSRMRQTTPEAHWAPHTIRPSLVTKSDWLQWRVMCFYRRSKILCATYWIRPQSSNIKFRQWKLWEVTLNCWSYSFPRCMEFEYAIQRLLLVTLGAVVTSLLSTCNLLDKKRGTFWRVRNCKQEKTGLCGVLRAQSACTGLETYRTQYGLELYSRSCNGFLDVVLIHLVIYKLPQIPVWLATPIIFKPSDLPFLRWTCDRCAYSILCCLSISLHPSQAAYCLRC